MKYILLRLNEEYRTLYLPTLHHEVPKQYPNYKTYLPALKKRDSLIKYMNKRVSKYQGCYDDTGNDFLRQSYFLGNILNLLFPSLSTIKRDN